MLSWESESSDVRCRQAASLQLMSFNVFGLRNLKDTSDQTASRNKSQFLAFLRKNDPDVLCVQENNLFADEVISRSGDYFLTAIMSLIMVPPFIRNIRYWIKVLSTLVPTPTVACGRMFWYRAAGPGSILITFSPTVSHARWRVFAMKRMKKLRASASSNRSSANTAKYLFAERNRQS
ncbi:MAG: hypothetical protein U0T81_18825 [Saprospiraceae bacterium]